MKEKVKGEEERKAENKGERGREKGSSYLFRRGTERERAQVGGGRKFTCLGGRGGWE